MDSPRLLTVALLASLSAYIPSANGQSDGSDLCELATPIALSPRGTCAPIPVTTQSAGVEFDLSNCPVDPESLETEDIAWVSFTATSESLSLEVRDVEDAAVAPGRAVVRYRLYGSCDLDVLVGCAGDLREGRATQLFADEPLVVGATYYLALFKPSANPGAVSFDLCLSEAGRVSAPDNDECAAAVSLPVADGAFDDVYTAGSTAGASRSDQLCDGVLYFESDDDVWYTFTAPDSFVYVEVANLVAEAGSNASTRPLGLSVYAGACGDLEALVCGYPVGWQIASITPTIGPLKPGTVYTMKVYTLVDDAQYAFDIALRRFADFAGSSCDDATPLTDPAGAATALNGKSFVIGYVDVEDPLLSPCVSDSAEFDGRAYFSFAVPTPETEFTLRVNGNSVFSLYEQTGDCDALLPVDCYPEDQPTRSSVTASTGARGARYLVEVLRPARYGGNPNNLLEVEVAMGETSSSRDGYGDPALALFPNPVANGADVRLGLAREREPRKVAVVDVTGQVVYAVDLASGRETVTVPTTKLRAGVYTVSVASDAGASASRRLVVR